MQRFRAASIALAILALSATAVLAAGPLSVDPSHSQPSATAHHAKATESNEPSEAPEESEAAEPTHAAKPSEAAEPGGSAEASHPVNHGCVVSLAAQATTPSGFKNHGQWVSSIAKDNHGHNKSQNITTCALPTGIPAPTAKS
jgi:hypothetical protein